MSTAILGRFMFRRRLWFTLNAERKSMTGFRMAPQSTTDQSLPRPAVEIELQSAGIYINSNDKHQFTIALVDNVPSFVSSYIEKTFRRSQRYAIVVFELSLKLTGVRINKHHERHTYMGST